MPTKLPARISWFLVASVLLLAFPGLLPAADATLTIAVDKPGHPISPTLYGIFFEDINCSADGGLYAEYVRNRNFEDADRPEHWSAASAGKGQVEITIDSTQPASAKNAHSLKVQVRKSGSGLTGVANEGFWGMSVFKGETYRLSFLARVDRGFNGPLEAQLVGRDGSVCASARVKSMSSDWNQYSFALVPEKTDPKARLVIGTTKTGTFWLDMVSLFPSTTWKGRPNGLRPDLAKMLAGLSPSFVRFPGGCWVEGDTMDLAYRWKQTVGDLSERRTQHNIWQYEATHGLGFHEYLQLCEDLNAEPLFVINCGMSHKQNVPLDKLDEFVQDALDAIEYANGPATSTWGAVRARNGHPAPFHLKFMEIGNENGGKAYEERYARFYDAIKAKYSDLRLIANEWSGRPVGRPIEIVDEHYYSTPEFFIQNAGKYDSYDRTGRKVYVGEYAVTQGCGEGNLRAAIGEAAFMTGMERNSDVVVMSSYAPLFANVNYKKWNPDLINFDSSRAYGLPSYYVQQMFGQNRGDVVLPVEVKAVEVGPTARSGSVGVGTWRTEAEFKDMKVTRGNEVLLNWDPGSETKGWDLRGGDWSAKDGVLHQKSLSENVRAFAGDKKWSNYTYTLKARKISGDEGFLVPFLVEDEEAKAWWNIGGWGNTRHALEMGGIVGNDVPGQIETGRWYDIRIEAQGAGIRCYLDGKLLHDVTFPKLKPLYSTASRTKDGREVILKVVNVSRESQSTAIQLQGASLRGSSTLTVLTSPDGKDENTLDEPKKVSPVTRRFQPSGSILNHEFPPNSVTVFRLRLK
jgi:alpha-L-arabinofuranosidase